MAKKNIHEYTIIERPPSHSFVLTVEVAIPVDNTENTKEDITCEIEDVLNELRGNYAAELVDYFYVATDFDATCKILSSRKKNMR